MENNTSGSRQYDAQSLTQPSMSVQDQAWHNQLEALNALGETLLKANSIGEALGIVGQSSPYSTPSRGFSVRPCNAYMPNARHSMHTPR